jgi:sugar transferase (PEP-CTERM system associated)
LPIDAILACKLTGMKVTEYLAFYEREAGRVDLDALHPSWLVYSDGFSLQWWDTLAKRAFDIIVSVLFLAFTLPITLIAAILVRLDSPGPIFYRQERVGQNGQTFTLMKFRSMRADAESGGPQWAAQNDARITRMGEFIRQTRIDEIPQIINVLRGDMSFIGPRPERPFFVESLSRHVPYYRERHRMKPGITGWAQINYPYGASIADAKEKMSYDLYYLKNFTIFLDVLILLQTARVVLWPAGVR